MPMLMRPMLMRPMLMRLGAVAVLGLTVSLAACEKHSQEQAQQPERAAPTTPAPQQQPTVPQAQPSQPSTPELPPPEQQPAQPPSGSQ
jgi:hypothetical protein